MTTPQNVLEIATSQIGVKENPPRTNMNPYGEWYGFNGVPWCAIFVSYCFAKAGIIFQEIPPLSHPGFAYCPWGVTYFKEKERFYTALSQAEVGDLVFFSWQNDGIADHIGIVESITDDGVIAIEGNTSLGNDSNGGGVMRRNRSMSHILGFGRVDFSTSNHNQGDPSEGDSSLTLEELNQLYDELLELRTAISLARMELKTRVGLSQNADEGMENTWLILDELIRLIKNKAFSVIEADLKTPITRLEQALQKTIRVIRNTQDSTKALQASVQVFKLSDQLLYAFQKDETAKISAIVTQIDQLVG